MPYCESCGQPLERHATRCPYCGTPTQYVDASDGNRRPATVLVRGPQRPGVPAAENRAASKSEVSRSTRLTFTYVERGQVLAEAELSLEDGGSFTFGREGCDVEVRPASGTVSGQHGVVFVENGNCYIRDLNSLNGLYLNGARQEVFRVSPGDVISVGKPRVGEVRTILIVGDASMTWSFFDLTTHAGVFVGRTEDNDLVIPHPTVSAEHAYLVRTNPSGWAIIDRQSSNGTSVNGSFVPNGYQMPLCSGALIALGNARLVFLDTCLLVFGERQGVDVSCENLVRYRSNKGKTIITTDHVSLHIKRGDFVAIVGGSGSGKSTILNELNGTEPADEGSVRIDGMDLYANYEMLKTSIGYVPQQDIVYDNLTLESMLASAAELRMTPDSTPEERASRIEEIIELLELDHVRTNLIGRLSGGQKKRASIAVELLADPRLLFLDEPTSGLDPGIERKLMQTLARMAHDGRTIILVTHTTLNLHLCDQVIFLGRGGKLCFAGDAEEAKTFFEVSDLVDVYNKIGDGPEGWQQRFADYRGVQTQLPYDNTEGALHASRRMPSLFDQFRTLSGRYIRMIMNDHSRLALLLGQGPVLALIISLVASEDCYSIYENGKSCLFALSCAAFWVGIFNSIQEICKERAIFRREYEGGVRLGAYTGSKVIVLGGLCLMQSAMLTVVFLIATAAQGHGMPGPGVVLSSGSLELFVGLSLLTLSAMCLGLVVSACFDNPDRAIALAPLLIMPQILFAGVVFKLNGTADLASYAVNCRWGMEALGTTLDLDHMDLAMYGETITVPAQDHVVKDIEVSPDEIGELEVETDFGTQRVKPKESVHIDEKEVHVKKQDKEITEEMLKHDPDDLDNNMFSRSDAHLLRAWAVLAGFSVAGVVGCYALLRHSVRRPKRRTA